MSFTFKLQLYKIIDIFTDVTDEKSWKLIEKTRENYENRDFYSK